MDGSFYGKISENTSNSPIITEKVLDLDLKIKLPKLYEEVEKRLKHAHESNKGRYDLRRRDIRFKMGQRVWKRNFVLSNASNNYSAKFAPRFIPSIVNKIISPVVYNLIDLDGKNLGNFHVSHIKPDITQLDDEDLLIESDQK